MTYLLLLFGLFLLFLQFRRAIISDVAKFKMTNVGQIKLVASAIDVTTEVTEELDTQAQVIKIRLQSLHVCMKKVHFCLQPT